MPRSSIHRLGILAALLLLPGTSTTRAEEPCRPSWHATFNTPTSALDGPVNAMAVFDDGGGPALFVGGEFTRAGTVIANGIARWDGETWSAVGRGVDGFVLGLTVHDDGSGPALIVAGEFSSAGDVPAGNIARWNGTDWSALGTGTNDWIRAVHVHDDGTGPALFVGGTFTTAGGVPANGIARWDGAAWSDLDGGMDGAVLALATHDDGSGSGPVLYAGGWFIHAGGVLAGRLARWDGAEWSSIGPVSGTVRALQVFDDGLGEGEVLYVAGLMNSADGVPANRIARWNGTAWSDVGGGLDGHTFRQVGAMTVFDDGSGEGPCLYVGGSFESAGGESTPMMARWNGSAWSGLGAGLRSNFWALSVHVLSVFDGGDGPALFAGGSHLGTPGGGAFLSRWSCVTTPRPSAVDGRAADLTADGIVDEDDLQLLLDSWGPCIDSECAADLDDSGEVDALDLATLLEAWR